MADPNSQKILERNLRTRSSGFSMPSPSSNRQMSGGPLDIGRARGKKAMASQTDESSQADGTRAQRALANEERASALTSDDTGANLRTAADAGDFGTKTQRDLGAKDTRKTQPHLTREGDAGPYSFQRTQAASRAGGRSDDTTSMTAFYTEGAGDTALGRDDTSFTGDDDDDQTVRNHGDTKLREEIAELRRLIEHLSSGQQGSHSIPDEDCKKGQRRNGKLDGAAKEAYAAWREKMNRSWPRRGQNETMVEYPLSRVVRRFHRDYVSPTAHREAETKWKRIHQQRSDGSLRNISEVVAEIVQLSKDRSASSERDMTRKLYDAMDHRLLQHVHIYGGDPDSSCWSEMRGTAGKAELIFNIQQSTALSQKLPPEQRVSNYEAATSGSTMNRMLRKATRNVSISVKQETTKETMEEDTRTRKYDQREITQQSRSNAATSGALRHATLATLRDRSPRLHDDTLRQSKKSN